MAEVLGAATSIVTLVGTAVKVFEYIKAVKDAPKDVDKLTSELPHLIGVLQILQTTQLTSEVCTLLESPLHQCLQELNSLRDKLLIRSGFKGALDRLKWPLTEGEVKKHIDQFERFKGLFTLALVVDNTELVRKLEPQLTEMISTILSFQREQELHREGEKQRLSGAKRDMLLKWLSAENFDGRHRETLNRRTEGTGQWIVQALELQQWISGNHGGRSLWGKGDPGVGKTFLCSVVIDHLQALARARNYAVAYFYFTYDNQDQQKLYNVLAALAAQLLIHKSHLPQDVELWYDKLEESMKKTRPTNELLETMIHHASKAFSQVFFVFDALDECNEDARVDFLLFLGRMRNWGVNFFVISRPHLEDLNESLADAATLQLSADQEDLKIYIENTIRRNNRAKHLFQDPNRKKKVVSVLTECAGGMFQFVYLLLDELCGYRRVSDMANALDELEHSTEHKTYAAIYDKTIQRVRDQPQSGAALAMITLVWLVKARRSLTIDELRIAVSVRPNISTLLDDDLPPRDSVVDVCGGLVTIDKTNRTVRLVHSTLQEHLLRRQDLIQQNMDFLILETCTTYLSFDIFKRNPCTTPEKWWHQEKLYPFFVYSVQYWQTLISSCREDVSTDIIHNFLKCPEAVYSYFQARRIAAPQRKPFSPWHESHAGQIPLHIACMIGHCGVVQRLLDEGESLKSMDNMGMMPLHIAVQEQNEEIVHQLLEGGAEVSVQDGKGWTPLHLAVQGGNEKIVAMLLNFGADVSEQAKCERVSLHQEVVAHKHSSEGIVRLLLERGAAISAQDGEGRTPLHLAVAQAVAPAYVSVPRIPGRTPRLKQEESLGWTPLHLAVRGRNEGVVAMLLNFGANVSEQVEGGGTLLHEAVSERHDSERVVRLLLERGAAVSAQDGKGWTPLHLAVQGGNEKIVAMLLDFGADVSERTKGGRTPLHEAASQTYGFEGVVRLLLERGAAVSAQDGKGWTPLHLAVQGGNEKIVAMLLNFGADVSARTKGGRTPLHEAAYGSDRIVRLLLKKGAGVSAQDNEGRTPLHLAASWEEGTVKALVQYGADALAYDTEGTTPLDLAVSGYKKAIIQLLFKQLGTEIPTKYSDELSLDDDDDGWSHKLQIKVLA